jgi:hypothetical protein
VLPAAGLVLAALLGGCGAPQQSTELVPPPPPPAVPVVPASPAAPTARAGVGLVPLPTRQEVVTSVPVGRRDPFGETMPRVLPAAPGAAGSRPGQPGAPGTGSPGTATALPAMPPGVPEGFRLAGVIRSGGRSEAVVQLGTRSGTLRPGDRGGRSTDLLPPGWSVASIDVNRGSLTLQQGGRRLIVEL